MADPNPSIRMCLDCKTLTTTPILLHAEDRTSGPAFCVYACVDCAPAHLTLTQSLDRLFEHTHPCPDCTPLDSCEMGLALARVHGRVLRRQRQITESAS
ncbi:hypothetical protein ABTX80_13780 [Streptomyces erythrochromogenes]|uniref:hypothetical protein n=1 Tax=Streptomyces erythrochromogenes TaxID=285574 RepID=UPI003316593B